jgi:hypothetical protein
MSARRSANDGDDGAFAAAWARRRRRSAIAMSPSAHRSGGPAWCGRTGRGPAPAPRRRRAAGQLVRRAHEGSRPAVGPGRSSPWGSAALRASSSSALQPSASDARHRGGVEEQRLGLAVDRGASKLATAPRGDAPSPRASSAGPASAGLGVERRRTPARASRCTALSAPRDHVASRAPPAGAAWRTGRNGVGQAPAPGFQACRRAAWRRLAELLQAFGGSSSTNSSTSRVALVITRPPSPARPASASGSRGLRGIRNRPERRARQVADAADVGGALGHRDGAAGVEQVEGVAAFSTIS